MTTGRSYIVGGDLVMIENDENSDGVFESITICHPGTGDIEMFRREPDGSVKPASTRTVEATKKQFAAVNEVFKPLFQTNDITDAEISDLLQKAKQKIEAAEKEKKDDKK